MSVPLIESVHFPNFKVLRDATLPLDRFTLLVGPNGSGKSTALQALKASRHPAVEDFGRFMTAGRNGATASAVEIAMSLAWRCEEYRARETVSWQRRDARQNFYEIRADGSLSEALRRDGDGSFPFPVNEIERYHQSLQVFSFDARKIVPPVEILPTIELAAEGANLAGVLDYLLSSERDAFEALNAALGRWLPEFDQILLETPEQGKKLWPCAPVKAATKSRP